MSLILDALKKAERERNLRQAPTLSSTVGVAVRRPRSRVQPIAIALALTVLVAGAAFAYFTRDRWLGAAPDAPVASVEPAPSTDPALAGASATAPTAVAPASTAASMSPDAMPAPPLAVAPPPLTPPAVAQTASERLAAEKVLAEGAQGPGAAVPFGQAPLMVDPIEAERRAAEKALADGYARAGQNNIDSQMPPPSAVAAADPNATATLSANAAVNPPGDPVNPPSAPTPPAVAVSSPAAAAESAPSAPWVWSLPLAVRQTLPKLALSMHFYSNDPSLRFVIVNDARYGEGGEIAGGVRVRSIERDGAVLEYQGNVFLLPRAGT